MNYEEELHRIVNHLLGKWEARNLGIPRMRTRVALIVTDKRTNLDQAPCTKSIVIKTVSYTEVTKIFISINPGMDRSPRKENEQEINSKNFSYTRAFDKLMFLARIQDEIFPAAFESLDGESRNPNV